MTDNPFVTNGYAGPEYFCDRIEETRTLTELLTNGNNVALISPRRLGKTDLIHHCFHQPEVKDHYYTFIIDIYATDSLRDFVNVFGKAILEDLKPKGRKAWEMFLNAIKSVRSEISFDINNNPVWGVNIGAIESPDVTLDEIFEYLRQADRHCIVAIDEFQQITRYNDNKNIEAVLRTHIQRCPNANFVFSGSQRHLMGEIFISLGEILELCKHTIRQRGTTENPKGNGGKSISTVPRSHSQRAEDYELALYENTRKKYMYT